MFTLLSGFAFIYFQLKSFFESLMRLKRYNQIVIIENIAKDTLQRVHSFKALPPSSLLPDGVGLSITGRSSVANKPPESSADFSSPSPTPSSYSRDYSSDIVISIDATAQKMSPSHS